MNEGCIMHSGRINISNIIKLHLALWFAFGCLSAIAFEFGTSQREFSIVATKEGYYPKKLVFFVGEKVHLYLTTTRKSSCFVFDPQNIFIGMRNGELVESTVYFDRPGVFKFYCPAGKIEGEFLVLAPMKKKVERYKRDVASASSGIGVRIWMPVVDEEVGK